MATEPSGLGEADWNAWEERVISSGVPMSPEGFSWEKLSRLPGEVTGFRILGKSVGDLAKEAAVSGAAGALFRIGLGSAGVGGIALGATAGAGVAGIMEIRRQAIENQQAHPERTALKEKLKSLNPHDKKRLVMAIGRGAVFGAAGGIVGGWVSETGFGQVVKEGFSRVGEAKDQITGAIGSIFQAQAAVEVPTATATSTSTPTPSATPLPSPTEAPTVAPISEPILPPEEPATPTSVPTAVPTETAVTPIATEVPTATATAEPLATPVPSATPELTVIPTSEPAAVPTEIATATPTSTEIPPTATATAEPSATVSPVPSQTSVPTAVSTETPAPIATPEPSPTTIVPSPTGELIPIPEGTVPPNVSEEIFTRVTEDPQFTERVQAAVGEHLATSTEIASQFPDASDQVQQAVQHKMEALANESFERAAHELASSGSGNIDEIIQRGNELYSQALTEQHDKLMEAAQQALTQPAPDTSLTEAAVSSVANMPAEVFLLAGSNLWEASTDYLRQALGREPTNDEILAVTKSLAKSSHVAVPQWNIGGVGFISDRQLPVGFKLIFDDSVKSMIKSIASK